MSRAYVPVLIAMIYATLLMYSRSECRGAPDKNGVIEKEVLPYSFGWRDTTDG